MPLSNEMRRLGAKWLSGTGWPKRLEWFELDGLRGWVQGRFDLKFPIVALVGENGAGKSTLLQTAAAVYRHVVKGKKKERYASAFFPATTWDPMQNVSIHWSVREGNTPIEGRIRRRGERWRGNPDRRERQVEYIDLSRIQPVPARVGYMKMVKTGVKESGSSPFNKERLARFSAIMGRDYELARMARTSADEKRLVPVIGVKGAQYSGFQAGAGETMVVEFLQSELPKYAIVLIDEIETSLHPRAQRRLMQDLAVLCRERELQILLTTHSPFILDELPPEGRAYIIQTGGARQIVYGVSPEFAMTKMDDFPQYECDLYVEDKRAEVLLTEILAAHARPLVQRCRIVSYGAGSVGQALGTMVADRRFPRPSCVFLDGDQGTSRGCLNLPGEDPPERLVFSGLKAHNWLDVATRTGRPFADVADSCLAAMNLRDHHDWIRQAATALVLSGDVLWQAMSAEWAAKCLEQQDAKVITDAIEDAIAHGPAPNASVPPHSNPPTTPKQKTPNSASPTSKLPLFER